MFDGWILSGQHRYVYKVNKHGIPAQNPAKMLLQIEYIICEKNAKLGLKDMLSRRIQALWLRPPVEISAPVNPVILIMN